ncbi:hypothetical protein ACHHYP_20432, partial [Achlya hypogyna]
MQSDLSNNAISDGSSLGRLYAFQSLTALCVQGISSLNLIRQNLSNNRIKAIQNIQIPPNLAKLDLTGNQITTFDVTTVTYNALQRVPELLLGTVSLRRCAGALKMLGSSVVCITDADTTPAFFGTIYGPAVLIFAGLSTLAFAYAVLVRCRSSTDVAGGNDRTLRA